MSDKEERILITKVSPHCRALRISCDPFDDDDGMFCAKIGRYGRITEKDCAKCKNPVLAGISRTEAVERMASAFCKRCKKDSCCCSDCIISKETVEASLDALLGGKNG